MARFATAVLLAAAIVVSTAGPAARAQEAGTLRIPEGGWKYHTGDDPRCGALNDAGCTWQSIPNGTFFGNNYYWKRAEVTLPEDLRKAPQLGLVTGDPYLVFEVYANGQLIGGNSTLSFFHAETNTQRILTLPNLAGPDGQLILAIRAFPQWKPRIFSLPLAYVLAAPDRTQTIADAETFRDLQLNATHYFCFAAAGFAGFVFLLLYSVNQRLWENLWLGASLFSVAALRVVEVAPFAGIWMPLWLEMVIYLAGNCLMAWILIEFVFSFLERPVPKILRLVAILGMFDAYYATGLPWPSLLQWLAVHCTPTAILIATLTQLLMLPVCFRSKLPEMRWIGASVLFITVENSARMAGQLGIPTPKQDVMWHGYDIDIRAISYLLFAIVMLIAMTFRLRRIQSRNREIEQEMAAARSVQQILIPDELPSIPGLTIESAYLPAQEVGGDFFQVLPILNPPDPTKPSAFIVFGDVSGKGLKAAMTVSLIVGTLRTYAEFYSSPAELLAGLNRRVHGRGEGFATCLALLVEPSGRITLANAGHPNSYLNGVEIATEANLPLGLALDVHYSESTLQLDPGQLCTLVTDGVVEATSSTRELFGFDRTRAMSAQPAARIAEAARNFGVGAPQADDITVLSIARTMNAAQAVA